MKPVKPFIDFDMSAFIPQGTKIGVDAYFHEMIFPGFMRYQTNGHDVD